MKFKSHLVTQVSGSVGGTTYAHNRGGMYMRARSLPTNPNTAAQQAARANLAALANFWKTALDSNQRAAWSTYAQNSPVTDAFGDPLILSGQQMYIRCNSVRLRGGLARVDDGPTTYGLTDFTLPTIAISVGGETQELSYDNTDTWATADGGGLVIQMSRYYDSTKNYFRGPYCFLDTELGNATPPTSPFDMGTESPFAQQLANQSVGQVAFFRLTASSADGRCSPVYKIRAVLGS